jgi:hypothetical protein
VISDDPAHFELLDGELAKDSRLVYWIDGSVLSKDPANFAIISDADYSLSTKDSSPYTSTATRSPTPIRRLSKSCRGLTHATTAALFGSTTRSPSRTCRPSGR